MMKYREDQMTGWISGDQKPVRDGVYLRKYPKYQRLCFFRGGVWKVGDKAFTGTADDYWWTSDLQNLPWRGLNFDAGAV